MYIIKEFLYLLKIILGMIEKTSFFTKNSICEIETILIVYLFEIHLLCN